MISAPSVLHRPAPRWLVRLVVTLGLVVCAAVSTLFLPGCATPPSARVAQVQTLKAVAYAVQATMRTAAQLRHEGSLTAEQWQRVAALHDDRWQPAFRAAVLAAQSDLSSLASPDLAALATELAQLIANASK